MVSKVGSQYDYISIPCDACCWPRVSNVRFILWLGRYWLVDLGVSDLERPSTDNVKHGFMVYVDRSDYEGVGMMELLVLLVGCLVILTWLVVGGEGDE